MDLMTAIEEHAGNLEKTLAHRFAERWFRAVAEEAGEVVGAYNKWQDGNTRKPKTPDDILIESGQLLGCLVISLGKLGFSPADLLEETDRFLVTKNAAIIEKGNAA